MDTDYGGHENPQLPTTRDYVLKIAAHAEPKAPVCPEDFRSSELERESGHCWCAYSLIPATR
jgi:hypothetical protein